MLPVTCLQKPRLHAPRTWASLANSLQSDLRWMMILVPVLTPEASAISNTPELRHTRKRESQFHTSLFFKGCMAGAVSLSWDFHKQSPNWHTERKGKVPLFLNSAEPPQLSTLSGTVTVEVWGMGLSCSLRTAPAHQELLLGCMSGWCQTMGERGRVLETSPPPALTLCVSEPLAQAI